MISKLRLLLFAFPLTLVFAAGAFAETPSAAFANPLVKTPNAGCAENNLRSERFAPEMNSRQRAEICQALSRVGARLNAGAWSPELNAELAGVWSVFSNEAVTFLPMPKGASKRMAALAEPFPTGVAGNKFEAAVYVRPEKSGAPMFFQVLMHELRHVYDFYHTWKSRTALDAGEVERRAFLLMSRLSEETGENPPGVPKLWKESWRGLPPPEAAAKRAAAVDKYLKGNKFYRMFTQSRNAPSLDFSKRIKSDTDDWKFTPEERAASKKGERLPGKSAPPPLAAVLPQNVREIDFDLQKPKNPRDAQEILRLALQNEKKLYYGMSNFVYDQKLQFQCWRKGKVSDSFSESNTVSRSENGNALFQTVSASAPSPCVLDSRNLKTDFAETFWVSPALDRMPIRFAGFVEIEGRTLARYTVLQPDARLFKELENEYRFIKPFRVFVGTIFVSPEDGQIVRFWGTSFPENTVTGAGSNGKKVWGSYSVTALRQKLNIDGGLWATVYVGTVALAEIAGSPRPFSYTVKFENYRQTTTDVRIIEEETAENPPAAPVDTKAKTTAKTTAAYLSPPANAPAGAMK